MLKEMPGRDVCESSPLFLPRPLPHQLPVIFQQQDEAMVWVTVKQATELTGKSRSSLYRDMARGRVSFRRGVNGHRVIDTCELIRMYGKLRLVGGFRQDGLRLSGVPEGMSSQALFAEIRSLRDEVVVLRQEVQLMERPKAMMASAKKLRRWWLWLLGGLASNSRDN